MVSRSMELIKRYHIKYMHYILIFKAYKNEYVFLLGISSLRHHSGEISSTLDSSTSFTNNKAFLQTCLKNDIIYRTDCFICIRKCEYLKQKSYGLYFPFIKS